jgi:hypothetical protein
VLAVGFERRSDAIPSTCGASFIVIRSGVTSIPFTSGARNRFIFAYMLSLVPFTIR